MDELVIPDHAFERMQQRSLTVDDVYLVVNDADEVIERDDGRTEYVKTLEDGREAMVIIEDDGITVVGVMVRNQRRLRRR